VLENPDEVSTDAVDEKAATDARDEPVRTLKKWKSEAATAVAVKKTIRTLRKWRRAGTGPPYARFGRTIMYDEDALADHFKQGEVTPVRTKQHRPGSASR
jgi:hypothetical protein